MNRVLRIVAVSSALISGIAIAVLLIVYLEKLIAHIKHTRNNSSVCSSR